jgi:hemerythrin-like domain-containing protein
MKITTTLLSYDHGLLRQVLDVIAEMAKMGTASKYQSSLPSIVDFLNRFMDQYHHGKEERFIFPFALHESGDWEGEINKLISEHRQAKSMVDDMAKAIEANDLRKFSDAGSRLAKHMQAHIKEEEDKVFPKLEDLMEPDEDMELFEQINSYSNQKFGADFSKKSETYANKLQDEIMGPGYFTDIA